MANMYLIPWKKTHGLIVDSSDAESQVVKLSDAQKYAKDVLNFMASQGSQIFNT